MSTHELPLSDAHTRRPVIAWPTLLLGLAAATLWLGSSAAALAGHLGTGWAIALNALAAFWAFTVLHDASHNAISQYRWLNDWAGRLAMLPLSPAPIFKAFRFIHMQHHRFTNQGGALDPDDWCGGGRTWTLPFRWATLDLRYYVYYLPKLKQRPQAERRETMVAALVGVVLVGIPVAAGYGMAVLLYWLIPARIAVGLLGFAFDFLPHHPYKVSAQENPWQATNNRVGMEWLLTPLLLYQNYHLVHHLYPRAPFYRYLRLWRAAEQQHLAQQPYLVSPLGRPLAPPASNAPKVSK